jgi:hypothetical protein
MLPGKTSAAAPQIDKLSLRGLQTGATTTITMEGTDLLPEPRLLLSVPVAAQTVKKGSNPHRLEMDVMLAGSVSPGIYQLRLANRKGISNPVAIGIDDLEQVPFASPIARLPAALHGTLPSSATLKTSFDGKKGQRVVLDLEARRLGAAIDAVVELYDPRQVQLAYSQGHAFLGGDARVEAVLPADGTYTVQLHDLLYQAGKPNHFRLKIGELYYADRVFPLGGQRGTQATFQLLGNPPAAARQLKLDLHTDFADIPVLLPARHGFTGTTPRVLVDDFPEVLEATPAQGKLQEVTVPAIINGRIGKPGEEDRYRLLVKPGMMLHFEVVANRAGSPLDGVLFVREENGTQLAMSDDRPNTIDPGLDITVADGTTSMVVALTDLESRGGTEYIYRLAITPADPPGFSLTLFEDRQIIPQGGAAVARIRASRAGYQGPIKLSLPELPEDIIVSGAGIPPGATDTLLSLSAPAGAQPVQLLTRIVGASDDPKSPIRRLAMLPETPSTELQPWLRSEFAVAIAEPAPAQIAWENNNLSLPIGVRYPAKLKVVRSEGFSGPIRLSLLTSQIVPKTSDGKRDDLNRALRIEGTPVIAVEQTTAVAPIIVPADLPAGPYDLAIRAELLNADGKKVLSTAVTPSRRVQARQPFTLQLVSPAIIEAKSGSGPTAKLKGKVIRTDGFTNSVIVTLTGLPAGAPAPTVTVGEDQKDFELPVAFPEDTKLGALRNLKVVATSQVEPQRVLKSNEISLNQFRLQFTP